MEVQITCQEGAVGGEACPGHLAAVGAVVAVGPGRGVSAHQAA